jgi:hypothetical protein
MIFHAMPRERKPTNCFTFHEKGGTNPTPPPVDTTTKKKSRYHYEEIKDDCSSDLYATCGFLPILSPTTVVAAPTMTVVVPPPPAEYWGIDADTVFVADPTTDSRVSLRWEQDQLENTVQVSATGKGVRTIFRNGE